MGPLTRRFLLACALTAVVAPGAGAAAGRHVLVFGGTGALGAEIVRLLVDQGDQVTVFTRPGSDRSLLAGLDVGFVEGDLLNAPDIEAAFRGREVDAVITAVRVETGDIHFYGKIMPPLTAAAKRAGVQQFIHSGAVGAGRNAEQFTGIGWERVPGLLDRLKDQGVGEDILRASGVPFTIIRNTRLHPPGTPATGKAELTEDQSTLLPMTRADLARLTVGCLGKADCLGKTFHVRDTSLTWPPPGTPAR
ncbi:MAG: NAD(P)H-binding protein [Gammaproteobacteria bacterium]|nr:MAG: NAD(P)H-binding protein [Gammaproteobacteria bacterium]